MSSLSSSSTLTEIEAAYADNASYEEDESLTKCAAFITACRLLLMKLPKKARQDSRELEMDLERISGEIVAAQAWRRANAGVAAGGSGVKHLDFSNFRD